MKIYNARAEPLFCSLNLLFGDVPVAVAIVVFLNFLIRDLKRRQVGKLVPGVVYKLCPVFSQD